MSDEKDPIESPEADQAAESQDQSDAATQAEADAAADHEATEQGFDSLETELADMKDRLLRAVADAENTRRRATKEVSDAKTYAITSFARDLLGVDDNLDRALRSMTPEMRDAMGAGGEGLIAGIEMTRKELREALSRQGVTPIDADPGVRFDPNLHQAVAQIPNDAPKDHIVDVVQSGWRIGERTLRAAMVAVSAGAPGAAAPTEPEAQAQAETDPASQDAQDTSEPDDASTPGHRLDTTI